jgi:hypothetical protein
MTAADDVEDGEIDTADTGDDDEVVFIETVEKGDCDFLDGLSEAEFTKLFDSVVDGFQGAPPQGQKMSNYTRVKKLCSQFKRNNYKIEVQYKHSKYNKTNGRLFAGHGIQNITSSVRRFLTCKTLNDYDMVNAHPEIMRLMCKNHGLLCRHLEDYCTDRAGFLKRNKLDKKTVLILFNQDKPYTARLKREATMLVNEFTENKTKLYEVYKDTYNSRPDSKNPVSSCINAVWCDHENRFLQEAISKVNKDDVSVLMFDGFMTRENIDIVLLNTGEMKWILKKNESNIVVPTTITIQEEPRFKWDVPRERYEYFDDKGKPRVRPFDLSVHRNIVECSDMGGGKSLQLYRLILLNFTGRTKDSKILIHDDIKGKKSRCQRCMGTHFVSKSSEGSPCTCGGHWENTVDDVICDVPTIGTRVLIIYHRVALIDSAMRTYYSQLGFRYYTDKDACKDAERLVICIDSLWKVTNEEWDLVAIDETPEVIKQLCSLKTKKNGSGKWETWEKLRKCTQDSSHVICLSAQADTPVKNFLDECGVQCHWQMNKDPMLGHLRYEIVHYEQGIKGKERGYRRLFDEIRDGKKVAIPCAEQKDLQVLEAMMRREFPGKRFLTIHGGLCDADKKANLRLAENEIFDGLLYTASMDCGVSIDIEGYDLVFFRLNNRSTDADVVMQMCQRVRKLNENLVIISCDSRVKDWDFCPGYNHTPHTKTLSNFEKRNSMIIKDAKNITETKAILMKIKTKIDVAFYYSQPKKIWYKFTRREAPYEITWKETKEKLTNPAAINELHKDEDYSWDTTLNQMMDDCRLMRVTMETTYDKFKGVVNLIVTTVHRQLNQYRNLLPEIIRIATLQQATLENTLELLEEDEEVSMTKTAEEIKGEIKTDESSAIMNARVLTMTELQILRNKNSTEHTKEDQHMLNRAYTLATFGDDIFNNIGEDHQAITNIKNQVKFRDLCSMDEPDNGYLKNLYGNNDKTFEYYIDAGRHRPAELRGVFEMMNWLGFTSITDGSTITVDDEMRAGLEWAVLGYKRLMKSGRCDRVDADSLRSAISTIRQQWSYKPIQVGRKGGKENQYKIGPCGDAVHWGTPTWGQYMSYHEFETNINTKPKDVTTDQSDKGIVGLFAGMHESNKRKRKANDDGDSKE